MVGNIDQHLQISVQHISSWLEKPAGGGGETGRDLPLRAP